MRNTIAVLSFTAAALFGAAGAVHAAPPAPAPIASPSTDCALSSIPYQILDAAGLDPTGTSRDPLVVAARDLMRSACTAHH
ncbi:MAG: hypothetical protein J2P18_11050 [Nocardia sp.]|nr:hypothetical protein [Nocardia sp.]